MENKVDEILKAIKVTGYLHCNVCGKELTLTMRRQGLDGEELTRSSDFCVNAKR